MIDFRRSTAIALAGLAMLVASAAGAAVTAQDNQTGVSTGKRVHQMLVRRHHCRARGRHHCTRLKWDG